ncbi:MAG: SUF system NifU family Fe-S cluster assembly protein [Myxococcota bacterium]
MPDRLKTLYRDVVLDHSKLPRHRETLPDADRIGEVHNPLCGDRVKVMLQLSPDGHIARAAFTGEGCAISTAAASVMCDSLDGASLIDALGLASAFRAHLAGDASPPLPEPVAALTAVAAWPARVRCASLPFDALKRACGEASDSPQDLPTKPR